MAFYETKKNVDNQDCRANSRINETGASKSFMRRLRWSEGDVIRKSGKLLGKCALKESSSGMERAQGRV